MAFPLESLSNKTIFLYKTRSTKTHPKKELRVNRNFTRSKVGVYPEESPTFPGVKSKPLKSP